MEPSRFGPEEYPTNPEMNIQPLHEKDNAPQDAPKPDRIKGVHVEISDTQSHLKIDKNELIRLVCSTLDAEGIPRASVSIAIVDDATIHQLNRRHLGHDWPTDVITFPLSDPGDPTLSGELVVSAEMAATTARQAEVRPWDELALYVVHGLLHLCGYDDAVDHDRDAMRRREAEILAIAGLSNTFTAAIGIDSAGSAATVVESGRCMT